MLVASSGVHRRTLNQRSIAAQPGYLTRCGGLWESCRTLREAMDLTAERRMIVRFEGFELDTRSGELRFKGEKIPLQEKPLRILQRLVDRPGDVVTRDDLRQALW